MNADDRKSMMEAAFAACYGTAPSIWTRAPGRVDLMGSHTDYNHGFILTMTIDRDTWIAARPRTDRTVRVRSLDMGGESVFSLDAITFDGELRWANYVRGMANVMQEAGYTLTGVDALIHTTVPVSAGLSSSAALEMAAGRMFEAAAGLAIDPVRLAVLGQRAENNFVGVNCGILDQYTSAVGKAGSALLLDARTVTSQDIPLAPDIRVVICDTHTQRELAGSEYGQRRAECEEGTRALAAFYPGITHLRDVSTAQFEARAGELDAGIARRCRFIVEENARVAAFAVALTAGDRAAMRELCAASFAGARDLYEITSCEMQVMLAAMLAAPGCIAARQAGAGFGGCMAAYVEAGAEALFAGHVAAAYLAATGIEPRIYPIAAAAGAGRMS